MKNAPIECGGTVLTEVFGRDLFVPDIPCRKAVALHSPDRLCQRFLANAPDEFASLREP